LCVTYDETNNINHISFSDTDFVWTTSNRHQKYFSNQRLSVVQKIY